MVLRCYKGGQKSLRTAGPPSITVGKEGRIKINRALFDKIRGFGGAELWFDDEGPIIGIKMHRAEDRQPHHHKVTPANDKTGGATIGAKMFIRWTGIDMSQTRRVPATYDETKRLITADLRHAVVVQRSGKAGTEVKNEPDR